MLFPSPFFYWVIEYWVIERESAELYLPPPPDPAVYAHVDPAAVKTIRSADIQGYGPDASEVVFTWGYLVPAPAGGFYFDSLRAIRIKLWQVARSPGRAGAERGLERSGYALARARETMRANGYVRPMTGLTRRSAAGSEGACAHDAHGSRGGTGNMLSIFCLDSRSRARSRCIRESACSSV
jgi:hypothetical protein